ncbi:DMP19 family protein [bacterium]|nr:DMP19 family protein [bacterium]
MQQSLINSPTKHIIFMPEGRKTEVFVVRKLSSFNDLDDAFLAFDKGDVDRDMLDDALHTVLSHHIWDAPTLLKAPRPVANFHAARTIEFDVGNGGFAQAAYNNPDFFDFAAEGYRAFGLMDAAKLIDKAATMLPRERRFFSATKIGELFEQFQESKLSKLDANLDRVGWWAIEQRISYALTHRDAFLEPDYRIQS